MNNPYLIDYNVSWKVYHNLLLVKNIKKIRYGDNYKEIIQKKWDMRKLNRNLKNKLQEKGINNKKGKI